MGEGVFELGNPEGRGAQAVLEIQVGGGESKNCAFCCGGVDFFWNNSIYLSVNLFVALIFVVLLDFSGQDFVLGTFIHSYSQQLDFLELNPFVDLSWKTKLTIHPT